MIKQFFKDSVIYGMAAILSRGIAFFLLPFYTRVFTPDEYGVIDYLAVMGSFVSVIVALEISQGLARFLPEHKDDLLARRQYASTSLWYSLASYVVFCGAIIVWSKKLSILIFDRPDYQNLLIAAAFAYAVSGMVYLVQNQLRWELRAAKSAMVSVLYALLSGVFAAVLILGFRWGIYGAVLSQIAAGLFSLGLALFYAKGAYLFALDRKKLREMLSFSLPLVPSSIAVVSSLYVDRIAIKELMSLEDVGYYGVGFRIAMIISLAMIGFQGALTPIIYNHYKDPETAAHIARLFRLFSAFSMMLFAGLVCFTPYIIFYMAGETYMPAVSVVPLLSLATLFASMYIFAPGLGLAKKTKTMAVINIAGAILNLVLNVLFIPYMGIMGAALATMISSCLVFALFMYYSQLFYPVPHGWPVLYKGLFISFVLAVVMYYIPASGLMDFTLHVTGFLVFSAILLSTGIIQKEELQKTLTFVRHGVRSLLGKN